MSNLYENIKKEIKIKTGDDMLDIDIHSKYGVLFVRLFGKLNKNTRGKMNKEVIKFISEVGIKNVVINIQNISEIDEIGKKELEKCQKIADNCLLCINLSQLGSVNRMKYIMEEAEAFNFI